MYHQLEKYEYRRVNQLFKPLEYQLISAAVLEGNHPGKVLVDDQNQPKTAFIFAPKMWCFLAGDPNNESFNQALNAFLFQRELMSSNSEVLLFVCHPDDAWQRYLPQIFKPRDPVPMPRYNYLCRDLKYDYTGKLLEGFTLHKLESDLLRRPDLKIPQ